VGRLAVAALSVSTLAIGTGTAVNAASDRPVAATDTGPVRGLATSEMNAFRGIPYAAAPVGALRWRPPQPPARWTGVRDATQFAPHCAQTASPYGTASTSEDCLYLNVYTPAKIARGQPHLAPVMVWIHGGGLVVGESNDYDPSRFVAQGVDVVTINYRLGELGFLAHPALAAESSGGAAGDYGLMDQQAALRWVQGNIRAFGGDPANVTIFGESAGGLSVNAQLVSPASAGLFGAAVSESGAYALSLPTQAAAENAGTAFASAAGCADQTAACLRRLPVEQILASQNPQPRLPNLDGVVLTESIGDAFASGHFHHVPVIEGSNRDEWRLFVAQTEALTGVPLTAAGYVPAIAATFGVPLAVANFFASVYPLSDYPSPSVALGALGTDAAFACPARRAATSLSQYVDTYQYEFADENAPMLFFSPRSFPTGAYHAAEIQYLLDVTETPVPAPALTPDQQQLSDTMVRYWTQFASTGDPNSSGTTNWPRYGGSEQFQTLAPPTPTSGTGFAIEHKCAFWDQLAG
jgi:para-nitrobenzyl esterase